LLLLMMMMVIMVILIILLGNVLGDLTIPEEMAEHIAVVSGLRMLSYEKLVAKSPSSWKGQVAMSYRRSQQRKLEHKIVQSAIENIARLSATAPPPSPWYPGGTQLPGTVCVQLCASSWCCLQSHLRMLCSQAPSYPVNGQCSDPMFGSICHNVDAVTYACCGTNTVCCPTVSGLSCCGNSTRCCQGECRTDCPDDVSDIFVTPDQLRVQYSVPNGVYIPRTALNAVNSIQSVVAFSDQFSIGALNLFASSFNERNLGITQVGEADCFGNPVCSDEVESDLDVQ